MKKPIIIAGNCVIETQEIMEETAQTLSQIAIDLDVEIILKGSYTKANRTSYYSFRSIGMLKALKKLSHYGKLYGMKTITDIHETHEANMAAEYVDMLQIPAFLCRQTELLIAAGKTGKPVNIKKGQFMEGRMMYQAAEKVWETGNNNIMVTERGNMFGYHDLIVDFRNITQMRTVMSPVLIDITHSLQKPNNIVTEGNWLGAEMMAKLGLTAGADGIYFETHPDPNKAWSDKHTQIPLSSVKPMLERILDFYTKINSDERENK